MTTSIRVIDDDEEICREVAGALASHGYDASWSSSLLLADEGRRPADVLVLDLGMPKTDGFQVIEALAATEQPPDLIVASGYDHRIIRSAVRSAEAAGLQVLGSLEKPYTIASLVDLIRGRSNRVPQAGEDPAALVRRLAASGTLIPQIRTAFQSKRRLADAAVIGYEALLRLSVGGIAVNPELVFSPAVDASTQLAATGVVLKDAMRFASVLRAAGKTGPVAVNCTPTILCEPEFQDMVERAQAEWQLPPSSLQIEITEHETATAFDRLAAAASRFAMRRCGVGVDDFGRGAASFERLTDLPLSELKIDKTVFWECIAGRIPMAMIEEVIRYCVRNGITSVVEGIETGDHWQRALAAGAEAGQGFLWDRPAFEPAIASGAPFAEMSSTAVH